MSLKEEFSYTIKRPQTGGIHKRKNPIEMTGRNVATAKGLQNSNDLDTNRISNASGLFKNLGIYKDEDDLGTITQVTSAGASRQPGRAGLRKGR